MKAHRKRKLNFIILFIIGSGLVIGLILFALRQNVSLFYTPSQIAKNEAPLNHTIRVGGMVEKGSVIRDKTKLEVKFDLTDKAQTVTVYYHGILPDLFREGQGIVAMGKLNQQHKFIASEVLAKHDENYMPPEVKHALDTAEKKIEKL